MHAHFGEAAIARFLVRFALRPGRLCALERLFHVYETDPLTCPKCQGEIRIISFIDQPEVIKKILQHLGLWEESHAPPENDPPVKEITFDPSCGSINSPS